MKEHVALVKRACRVCHQAEDAEILLAKRYDQKGEPLQDLAPLNHQVIGFIDQGVCDKCKEKFNTKEYYILVEVDAAQSPDHNNPWCTGKVIQIKIDSDFGRHLLSKNLIKNGMAYIPIEVVNQLEKQIEV